ncbi:hypothetical protein [Saccharopolyspora phatthalungensis]|uniref:Uncharacterized protein n=1 Tax=Saccharopolyspora phatthalungensis TaxID=664693 RepID=A0A840QJH4_9PSEU|nr:hypothetical protein [Saccharopolyspora phatthalungensis]MBB5159075.1 hypothetical protein [Saccharopolyspora phatthalungensis]
MIEAGSGPRRTPRSSSASTPGGPSAKSAFPQGGPDEGGVEQHVVRAGIAELDRGRAERLLRSRDGASLHRNHLCSPHDARKHLLLRRFQWLCAAKPVSHAEENRNAGFLVQGVQQQVPVEEIIFKYRTRLALP